MGKRERFTATVTCPKCGRNGTAECEELENPVYSRGVLNRTIESVSTGFVKGSPDAAGDQRVLCSKCRVAVTI